MNEHYYNIDLERCEITPLGKHPNWHSANEKFEADCRDNFCWIERAKSLRNLQKSIEKHLMKDGEMATQPDETRAE